MFFLIDLVIQYIMTTLKCNEYIYFIIRLSASETVDLDSFVCFVSPLKISSLRNLAYNGGVSDTARVAVEGWIKSPGHRKNLEGAFDLCGIGTLDKIRNFWMESFLRGDKK